MDVRVRQALDDTGGLYAEGSYSYVRIEELDGEKLVEARLPNMVGRTRLRLDPGDYRLISFQRPCNGNCGDLDSPTDQCDRAIHVQPGSPLQFVVTLSPGDGCTIRSLRP